MRPVHKALVVETWSKVAGKADAAARLFYGRLFEIDPTTRALFNGADITEQRRKLILALTLVVQGLDRFESLVPTLAALGRRHAQYRVSDQHYKTVGEALLWTLKQDLQSDWTPEVEEAWCAAYTSVSDVMRAGARDLTEDCSVGTVEGGAMPFESHFDERDRTGSLDAGEPLLSPDWWITRP
jgi:hemoglobin-like flavoprotein